MSPGWIFVCSLWVGGIFVFWDECGALLGQIGRNLRKYARWIRRCGRS